MLRRRSVVPIALFALLGSLASGALRELKRAATRDIVGKLIDKLVSIAKEKKYAAVRREMTSALRDLTEKDIDDPQDWKNWWSTNGASFEPKKAVEGGKKGGGD